MKTNLLRLVFGLAMLLAPGRVYGQYLYYYSNAWDGGSGIVYGSAITDDPGMYGTYHTWETQADMYSPSGQYMGGSSSWVRVDIAMPTYAETGRFRIYGWHAVRCSYWGYLVTRAPSGSFVDIAPPRQFTLTEKAFIPAYHVTGQASCSHPIYGDAPLMYRGDNRGFDYYSNDYRALSRISVTPARGTVDSVQLLPGVTRAYAFFIEEDSQELDCWK